MFRLVLAMLSIAMTVTLLAAVPAGAQPLPEGEPLPEQGFDFELLEQEFDFEPFKIKLRGFTEVPAIATEAEGKFELEIVGDVDPEEDGLEAIEVFEYTLSYEFPNSVVTEAHLRFGRKLTNGGIMATLCSNDPPDTDIPSCPEREGTVTGLLSAESIVGPVEQGIVLGDFRKAVRAFEKGAVYVQVHTMEYPSGEIRGQLNDFEFRPIIIGGPGEPDGFPCDPNAGFPCEPEGNGDFPCDPNAGFPCEPEDGQEPFPGDEQEGDFPCNPEEGPCDSGDGGEPFPDDDPNAGGEPDP